MEERHESSNTNTRGQPTHRLLDMVQDHTVTMHMRDTHEMTRDCTDDMPCKPAVTSETPFMPINSTKSSSRDLSQPDVIHDKKDVRGRDDVDSGWAWVVLLASCLICAIQEMMYSVVGMFQVEFQGTFGGSRGFLALIGSIFLSTSGMLAPVAGVLSTQLTPRLVIMLGGVLLCLGMVTASFCQNTQALFFTYGVLSGLGNGLTYTPSTTGFSAYFIHYRQMANGFVMAAPGLGSLLGPFLLRSFIDMHGWRFSMAVCGFITAQICVLGALFFPFRDVVRDTKRGVCCGQSSCCLKRLLRKGSRAHGAIEGSKEETFSETREAIIGHHDSLKDQHSAPSIRKRIYDVIRCKEVWIVCVVQMMLVVGYNINHVHLPSYLRSVGVQSHHFPYMYLVFGLSLIITRVIGGFVFMRFNQHLIPVMFVSDVMMAVTVGLMPVYGVTLPALYLYNMLIGMTFGLAFMLTTPVLIDFIGVDNLPVAFGMVLMCCGSVSVGAASLAGFFYDLTGSYKASFYLAGSLVGVGALTLLLLLCLGKKKQKTSIIVNTVNWREEHKD